MSLKSMIKVSRMDDERIRQDALAVAGATYREEKRWIDDEAAMVGPEELTNPNVSWFVVYVAAKPVGVLRVLYDPPLELYRKYGMQSLADGLDVEAFLRANRIAEIGRFAILPAFRRYSLVVALLMRAASKETLERGFTHYVTDIFEGEQHSPYNFHTRIMGFQLVATHEKGELHCPNRRITMILDLRAAYLRLRKANNWIFRILTEGWSHDLHQRLLQPDGEPVVPFASGRDSGHSQAARF